MPKWGSKLSATCGRHHSRRCSIHRASRCSAAGRFRKVGVRYILGFLELSGVCRLSHMGHGARGEIAAMHLDGSDGVHHFVAP